MDALCRGSVATPGLELISSVTRALSSDFLSSFAESELSIFPAAAGRAGLLMATFPCSRDVDESVWYGSGGGFDIESEEYVRLASFFILVGGVETGVDRDDDGVEDSDPIAPMVEGSVEDRG